MKYLLGLGLVLLNAMVLSAQTYTGEARTSATTNHRLTVNIQNGVAYVTRQSIPLTATSLSGVTDFANVTINNGVFTIPNDGNMYWLVPFNGEPPALASAGQYCTECHCEGDAGPMGSCALSGGSNGSCSGSCGVCISVVKPCNSSASFHGSVAIVKARQVILN